MPPTSMTSESRPTAPTTPATDAITWAGSGGALAGRRSGAPNGGRRNGSAGGLPTLRRRRRTVRRRRRTLPRQRLAHGSLVGVRPPGERSECGSVQDARPEPFPGAFAVGRPDRDGQSVGGVIRGRDAGHAQDEGDHPADLLLVGRTVAGHRALHLAG